MSDIVERLRARGDLAYDNLSYEAADQIERLRADNEMLLNVIRYIDENGESDGGDAMAEYARRALEPKP